LVFSKLYEKGLQEPGEIKNSDGRIPVRGVKYESPPPTSCRARAKPRFNTTGTRPHERI
jgi:hypothetical protein